VSGRGEHAIEWGAHAAQDPSTGLPSLPRPERLLERVVQYGHAHREKRLNGVAVPAHLLSLDHPRRNDPRAADGKPNLTAPTPRTSDGKPDFTGVWMGVELHQSRLFLAFGAGVGP
jgi:hypothetical protein